MIYSVTFSFYNCFFEEQKQIYSLINDSSKYLNKYGVHDLLSRFFFFCNCFFEGQGQNYSLMKAPSNIVTYM